MSTSLGELFFRIGIAGAQGVVSDLKRVSEAAKDAGKSAEGADDGVKKMKDSLMSLAGEAKSAMLALGAFAAGAAAFSGVNLAAKYERVEIGLTNILHSADGARRMMGALIQMGQETPFETSDLVGFSRELLATGSSAEEAIKQLRTLANVGANMGLPVGEVGEMTRLLGGLRSHAKGGAEIFQALQARGVNIAETLAAGGGPRFTGQFAQMQASQFLGSMTGAQAFQLVMTGLEKLNPTGAQSFLSVMQNLSESWRNVMLPTGRLLLPVLGAVGQGLMAAANAIGKLNEVSGGSAGLAVMIMGVWRAKTVLISTAIRAATAVRLLAASIDRLSASAAVGAGTTATSGAAGAGAAAGTGAAAGAGGLKALWASLRAGGVKGLAGRIGAGLKGMKGFGIGMAVDLLGNLLGDAVGGGVGNVIKNMATFGGLGAIFGAPGAAIGAVAGLIKGLWENSHGGGAGADAQAEIARNTGRTADYLESLSGRLIGPGGKNASRAISEIEIERSLARALMLA